jgi:hypothetical protein
MAKKRYTMEQIIAKLRAAEIELGKGQKTPDVRRKLGISEQTYYRWREYGACRSSRSSDSSSWSERTLV